jgi:hypothetical protein
MHHANVNLKSRAQETGAAVGPERLRKTTRLPVHLYT